MRCVFLIFCILLIAGLSVQADTGGEGDSTQTQVVDVSKLYPVSNNDSTASVDTIYYVPREAVSTAAVVSNPTDFEEHLSQGPTIALFKSMVVPGWGQLGNRKYLKAAVIIGLETWLISNAVKFGRLASEEYDRFEAEDNPVLADSFYDDYQEQRTQRNKYRWFAGLVIFASMFDAYVDAHLSGAPDQVEIPKVGFDIGPDLQGGFSASLSVSF